MTRQRPIEWGERRCGQGQRRSERAIETGVDEPAVIELEIDRTDTQIELRCLAQVIDQALSAQRTRQGLRPIANIGGLFVPLRTRECEHSFT